MAKATIENLRNMAFCGHSSAGKTTLIDRLLAKTGAVKGHPCVDEGTSICDFDAEEKHHKHTIEATVVHWEHGGKRFNVIDTPGYPDFIGQTIGALYGVDTAVIVINAHAGIGVNTRRVFDEAGKAGLGRILVISKMDTENVDLPALVEEIRNLWGPTCSLMNVPIGHGHDFRGVVDLLGNAEADPGSLLPVASLRDALIESIVQVDEQALENYLEGSLPSDNDLPGLLERAVADGAMVPIFCCSGRTESGLSELLDGLARCGLSPLDVNRSAKKEGERLGVVPKADGPLIARVFRTRIDPFVQKLSFVRVLSGTLRKDMSVHLSTSKKLIKLGPLLESQGSETHPVDEAGPGEIVALAKMEDLHTGTVIGDYDLDAIPFPTPMVGLAVHPKTRGDETKLSGALHKILEEDPTFRLDRDAQTKELVMTGMSELHLQFIRERLARRDKLEVETQEPKVPYRETIQANAEGMYRHKKQSGGRGQFGEVHIRMYPLPRGTNIEKFITKERFPSHKEHHYDAQHNFLWVDSVVGGSIPGNFMPAIEKGFKERLERGVIAGFQVQDLCVEVHFGKHHPVDSSEAAFKTAGSMVFRNVFREAKPSLLEPVVHMAITAPASAVGDIYSDMSGRRGRVLGSDSAGGNLQTVHAEVPLAEITTYARSLSSLTGGQGSYTVEFSHYDVVPANVQHEILAKSKIHEEVDEDE